MDAAHVHLQLHADRAVELRRAAAEHRTAVRIAGPGRLARLVRRRAPSREPVVAPALLLPPRPRRPRVIDLDAAVELPRPRESAEATDEVRLR